ncbi:hypothetical protein EMIT0P2_10468 [Pseudomonas sp. IT-P2]|jgi:hypothetical protein
MSVHSICPVQYRSAVYHRTSNFCLKFVGDPCNPFFISCAHYVQGLVRSFLGKLKLTESPAMTGPELALVMMTKCHAHNCFK